MGEILGFAGQYRFLSNFWPAVVEFEGVRFPSVENAYQAAKTSYGMARVPFEACTAAEAKALGKKVELRPDWAEVKLPIMQGLVDQKFAPGTELAIKLNDTMYDYLEETNTWGDQFFGVCGGFGRNHMGKMLMERRWKNRSGSLVIFGSRSFSDRELLRMVVEKTALFKTGGIRRLVTGCAPGADKLGEQWAKGFNRKTHVKRKEDTREHPQNARIPELQMFRQISIPIKEMPASWDRLTPGCRVGINQRGEKYNKDAGHTRNRAMAVMSTHGIGFWDGTSPGTRNMINECLDHDVKVLVWHLGEGRYYMGEDLCNLIGRKYVAPAAKVVSDDEELDQGSSSGMVGELPPPPY